jgi:hypothetical protein
MGLSGGSAEAKDGEQGSHSGRRTTGRTVPVNGGADA